MDRGDSSICKSIRSTLVQYTPQSVFLLVLPAPLAQGNLTVEGEREGRLTSMPGDWAASFAFTGGSCLHHFTPRDRGVVRMSCLGTPHKTNTGARRALQRCNPEPGLSLRVLSSPQHRRLSLSSQSQQGLALKATDFFFPLASRTKEGHFVNYLLVSDQQKVLSLSPPPHLILLKFDYKD